MKTNLPTTVKPTRDYAAICHQYAADVAAGRVVACVYVKQACQRHLLDLSAQGENQHDGNAGDGVAI